MGPKVIFDPNHDLSPNLPLQILKWPLEAGFRSQSLSIRHHFEAETDNFFHTI